MSEFKYDKQYLLDQTNGGLDVILRLYPEAEKSGRFVHFFLRFNSEDTASSIIMPLDKTNGIATVKDFHSGESFNCFDLVMREHGLDFGEACKWIASEMNVDGLTVQFNKPEIEWLDATDEENHGDCQFEYHPKLTKFELEVLGPLVSQKDADIFQLKSCKSFSRVIQFKDHPNFGNAKKKVITTSTEKYPILVFDYGDWQKIYQPLNSEKKYRFSYAGEKPENFVFGLESLKEYYYSEWLPDHVTDDDEDPKFKHVIIAGGDRDGLNVSSLGYPVVWLNSETAKLDYDTYKQLSEIAHNVCYCGDIDDTGVKETIKLALDYININIIWLPEWIKEQKYRGKSCKDVTDFCKLVHSKTDPEKVKRKFNSLVQTSLPSRFWNEKFKNGKFAGYDFNNEACYRFLQYNGFFRYQEEFAKDAYSFIKIENEIVERVKAHEVTNFPAEYIRETARPISLLNFIHTTTKISEKKFAALQLKEPDFSKTGPDFQRIYFENEVWTITKDDIKATKYGNIGACVWKDHIIKHRVSINKNKSFKITYENGEYDIEILRNDNHFLNYLINTSRVHWRKCGNDPFTKRLGEIKTNDPLERKKQEAAILADRAAYREANKFNIAEEGLSDDEIYEQKQHLINKLFAWGYLLHTYKRSDKAWMPFAMDYKISDVGASNGGSGKSILFNTAVTTVLTSYKNINAGDPKIVEDKFMFDGVDKNTDYVIMDDADSRFPFRNVFNNITGEFSVNKKNVSGYSLKFHESPKMAITSNFGVYDADGSTLRRLLFVIFSDYYHFMVDGEFEEHKPSDDFGKNLIDHFDQREMNDFFNLAAEALQFYLGTDVKINPPLENVNKRNSLQTMGGDFKEWADSFFGETEMINGKETRIRLNVDITKEDAYTHYKDNIEAKFKLSKTKFKKRVEEWCKFYGYIFNPIEMRQKDGRIMRSISGTTTEIFHIATREVIEGLEEPPRQTSLEDDLEEVEF